jgi:hypothetical protein
VICGREEASGGSAVCWKEVGSSILSVRQSLARALGADATPSFDDFGLAACVPVKGICFSDLDSILRCCSPETFQNFNHFGTLAENRPFTTESWDKGETCADVGRDLPFLAISIERDDVDGCVFCGCRSGCDSVTRGREG